MLGFKPYMALPYYLSGLQLMFSPCRLFADVDGRGNSSCLEHTNLFQISWVRHWCFRMFFIHDIYIYDIMIYGYVLLNFSSYYV